MTERYKYLEELIDLKRSCTIRFRADNEAVTTLRTKITGLHSRGEMDYIRAESGLEIKVDRIIEIDGRSFQAFT